MHRTVLLIVVYLTIMFLLTAFCAAWLWYIRYRPAQWAARVDKPNRFCDWLIPVSINEKLRRFEKGKGFQLLVALELAFCGAVFGSGLVIVIRAFHRAGIF